MLKQPVAFVSTQIYEPGANAGEHEENAALQPSKLRAALRGYVQLSRPWAGEEAR